MKLFFDLDGPILNVTEKYYQSYLKALNSLGGVPLSKAEYWEMKQNKVPNIEILNKSNLAHKLNEFQKIRNHWIEHSDMMVEDFVWEDLKPIYRKLSEKYSLVLVTLRENRDQLLRQLENLGIINFFSVILSSPAVGNDKWKVKVNLIQKHFKKDTFEDSFFCGDTETDILAAHELKMQSVGVTFGIRSTKLMENCRPN